MKSTYRTLAMLAAASNVAFLSGVEARATAFAGWQVSDVPWGDTLNVRKYPSSSSQKQAAYPNGMVLQMTGRCTGGVNLLDIADLSPGQQEQQVRYRWCEVWHDPAQNGNYVTGWVYGKYITPY